MALKFHTGETRYEGAVLDRYEQNLAHDSYFHAVVWDGERVTTQEYGSTAYGGPQWVCDVDATPEVVEAALAWFRPRWLAARIADAERIAAEITVGKRVRSTTTRGKNVGVVGTARRVVPNTFVREESAIRVQVELDETGEMRWMDGNRLEVIDRAPLDFTELTQVAQFANPGAWRNAVPR